jgi:hypothetical protein
MKLDRKLRDNLVDTIKEFNNAPCVKRRKNELNEEEFTNQIEECAMCTLYRNPTDSDICIRFITAHDAFKQLFEVTLDEYRENGIEERDMEHKMWKNIKKQQVEAVRYVQEPIQWNENNQPELYTVATQRPIDFFNDIITAQNTINEAQQANDNQTINE